MCLDQEDTVPAICVHGHKEQAPTAEVFIEVKNQVYLMKVGVASELPYPVLLGTDLPTLYDLIQDIRQKLCGVVTRSKARANIVLPVLDTLLPVETDTPNSDTDTSDCKTDTLHVMLFHEEEVKGEPAVTQEERWDRRRQQVGEYTNVAARRSARAVI